MEDNGYGRGSEVYIGAVEMEQLLDRAEPVQVVCSGEDLMCAVNALGNNRVLDETIQVSPQGEIFVNGRKVIALKPRRGSNGKSKRLLRQFQAIFFFHPDGRTDIELPLPLEDSAFQNLPETHQQSVLNCLWKAFYHIGTNIVAQNLENDLFSEYPLTMPIDIPLKRILENIRRRRDWSEMGLTISSNGVLRLRGEDIMTFARSADGSVKVLQHAIFPKAHQFRVENSASSPLFTDAIKSMVWKMLMDVVAEFAN